MVLGFDTVPAWDSLGYLATVPAIVWACMVVLVWLLEPGDLSTQAALLLAVGYPNFRVACHQVPDSVGVEQAAFGPETALALLGGAFPVLGVVGAPFVPPAAAPVVLVLHAVALGLLAVGAGLALGTAV